MKTRPLSHVGSPADPRARVLSQGGLVGSAELSIADEIGVVNRQQPVFAIGRREGEAQAVVERLCTGHPARRGASSVCAFSSGQRLSDSLSGR